MFLVGCFFFFLTWPLVCEVWDLGCPASDISDFIFTGVVVAPGPLNLDGILYTQHL